MDPQWKEAHLPLFTTERAVAAHSRPTLKLDLNDRFGAQEKSAFSMCVLRQCRES